MKRLDHYWYHKTLLTWALLPLAGLFYLLAALRRWGYQTGFLAVRRIKPLVIVVGNITVGGSGKTPLVIWLVEFLTQKGFTPGIVSRGYRAKTDHFPQHVDSDSDPHKVGDEAVLLARRAGCPMVIDPNRVRAARVLAEKCDVIISDDGLQHYALGRDIEIAVVDGMRRFGNGHHLPAGPLREPISRLGSVDMVVCNGGEVKQNEFRMELLPLGIYNLHTESMIRTISDIQGRLIHAVAGIGNPARFFNQLRELGLTLVEHAFPDHHDFKPTDLHFGDGEAIVMTEKDAVKCRYFAEPHYWYMPVKAKLEDTFSNRLLHLLERKVHG